MNKKMLSALLAITSIGLANTKINNIEITNLKQLSEDVIKNALPVKEGNEYTNKVSNDIYLSLLRTGLVQNANIYPTKESAITISPTFIFLFKEPATPENSILLNLNLIAFYLLKIKKGITSIPFLTFH